MGEAGGLSHAHYALHECYIDHMEYMIGDAILTNQNVRVQEGSSQEPFCNMVQAAQQSYMMVVQPTVSSLLLFGY